MRRHRENDEIEYACVHRDFKKYIDQCKNGFLRRRIDKPPGANIHAIDDLAWPCDDGARSAPGIGHANPVFAGQDAHLVITRRVGRSTRFDMSFGRCRKYGDGRYRALIFDIAGNVRPVRRIGFKHRQSAVGYLQQQPFVGQFGDSPNMIAGQAIVFRQHEPGSPVKANQPALVGIDGAVVRAKPKRAIARTKRGPHFADGHARPSVDHAPSLAIKNGNIIAIAVRTPHIAIFAHGDSIHPFIAQPVCAVVIVPLIAAIPARTFGGCNPYMAFAVDGQVVNPIVHKPGFGRVVKPAAFGILKEAVAGIVVALKGRFGAHPKPPFAIDDPRRTRDQIPF